MWAKTAGIILRYRILMIVIVTVITIFMAFKAKDIRISYEFAPLLPEKDTAYIHYEKFRELFGEDNNVAVIAIQDSNFYSLDRFNDWIKLGDSIENTEGVTGIVSICHSYNLIKNSSQKNFSIKRIFPNQLSTQNELDSLSELIHSLPFYDGILFNDSTNTYLLGITFDDKLLAKRDRELVIQKIREYAIEFGQKHNIDVRISGLAYTRTLVTQKIRREMGMFVFLAIIITAGFLYLFFRSFRVIVFPVLVVGIAVIWAVGSIVLLGYEITILTALIPPLIIVIGIPNSVFLLNKYHAEFKRHGNKIKALQRVIYKVGNATFLTNLTTASGFATFIVTDSSIMKEFGIVASINVMCVFILSIILIPTIFSFKSPPENKQIKHLENKYIGKAVRYLVHFALNHRKSIYISTISLIFLGAIGISLMKSTGYILADVPKDDQIYLDLKFFEKNFNGVMPLEIMIDTKEKGGVIKRSTLQRIDKLQNSLKQYEELSASTSIVNAYKFARQSYFNGDPKHYKFPSRMEENFLKAYIAKASNSSKLTDAFVDSLRQRTRITLKVADVGTLKMEELYHNINEDINRIFPNEKYNVLLTGTSIVYFKGAAYLIKNLFISLLLAILVISLFMTGMFRSFKITAISLIPNLIPLLLTASIMGYFNIPIKPSTVLIFSIALGISIDDTIHFLAKFRQELYARNWDLRKSVIAAIEETGVSMMYTSVILFFGFGIFIASSFGGTVALGLLVSITLLIAMASNLFLLPSLLLSLDKSITRKSFREPLIDNFDEEIDIDWDKLEKPQNTHV